MSDLGLGDDAINEEELLKLLRHHGLIPQPWERSEEREESGKGQEEYTEIEVMPPLQ